MGAEELPPEFVASAEAAAFEVEAAQVRAWSRCAEYLQQIVNGSTSGILDSRSAALILRHEAAMRGHLLAMADQMTEQGEETRGALEEDGRIIDRLMKDLGGARADVLQARAEAEALRAERDAALARLAAEPSEGRGCVVIELGVTIR